MNYRSQMRHYASPEAVAKLDEALASAKRGDTQSYRLASQRE